MLREWNETAADYASDEVFSRAFEKRVAQCPEAIAVSVRIQDDNIWGSENAQANTIARTSFAILGAGPSSELVGLCLDRSILLLAALIGVHKSGGGYIPLDTGFPPERLAYMLSDSGSKVLLTAGGPPTGLEVPAGIAVLDLTAEQPSLDKALTTNLDTCAASTDAAYSHPTRRARPDCPRALWCRMARSQILFVPWSNGLVSSLRISWQPLRPFPSTSLLHSNSTCPWWPVRGSSWSHERPQATVTQLRGCSTQVGRASCKRLQRLGVYCCRQIGLGGMASARFLRR